MSIACCPTECNSRHVFFKKHVLANSSCPASMLLRLSQRVVVTLRRRPPGTIHEQKKTRMLAVTPATVAALDSSRTLHCTRHVPWVVPHASMPQEFFLRITRSKHECRLEYPHVLAVGSASWLSAAIEKRPPPEGSPGRATGGVHSLLPHRV